MEDALVLRDVCKRYGAFQAVDHLSFSAPLGQIVGFLGPNGAGKTTTIRMIMSILYPDSGEIRVLGAPRAMEVKDRLGYLPEERGLYRKMTVERTLAYFGRLKGLRGRALDEAISSGLQRVGLSDWRRKPVEALSKGMSQKVQFVATTLHQPEVVILDEPFSGLDPINSEVLTSLVLDLRNRGALVIFSTHQMEQAQRLCDRIVLINRGRKLIDGAPGDIRAQFETRTLILEGEGDYRRLAEVPGVAEVSVNNGRADVSLANGAEPNQIVRQALDLGRLRSFNIHRPDLHEIFVNLIQDDARARGEAAAEISK